MLKKRTHTVIYLAGPYRSKNGTYGVKKNIDRAMDVARELWLAGYAVICPHMNTAFMDGASGSTDQLIIDGDLELVRRSDALVVLPDWYASEGTRGEIAAAEDAVIPVYYWADADDRGMLLQGCEKWNT